MVGTSGRHLVPIHAQEVFSRCILHPAELVWQPWWDGKEAAGERRSEGRMEIRNRLSCCTLAPAPALGAAAVRPSHCTLSIWV